MSVWGPFSYVKQLKHTLKDFLLNIKLELSEEKTLITNIQKQTARFLGTLIGTDYKEKSRARLVVSGVKRRLGGINITMKAPISSLCQRLTSKGFIEIRDNKFFAKPVLSLSPLPTKDLILRYRSILNGYTQYYLFADNIKKLRYIYLMLRNSLEKTIRYKEKLTAREFLTTYGKNIKVNITKRDGSCVSLDFPLPSLKHNPNNFLFKRLKDPLAGRK